MWKILFSPTLKYGHVTHGLVSPRSASAVIRPHETCPDGWIGNHGKPPACVMKRYKVTRQTARDRTTLNCKIQGEETLMTKVAFHADLKRTPEAAEIKTHNRWHPDIPFVETYKPGAEF